MGSAQAFLQARMGSRRLPGKVLLRLEGKSLLERAIERLRAAQTVDEVVVLTTTLSEDDEIALEAQRLEVPLHRGPDRDVLKRFQQAALRYRPAIIVRATADNPLIDIGSVDRIVRALKTSTMEYCIESDLPVGAATEAILAEALQRVDRAAKAAHHREHVTLYVKEHLEKFRAAFLAPPDALRRPDLRLTVDTPEDFIFMEDLLRLLPESDGPVALERYLEHAATLSRAKM